MKSVKTLLKSLSAKINFRFLDELCSYYVRETDLTSKIANLPVWDQHFFPRSMSV